MLVLVGLLTVVTFLLVVKHSGQDGTVCSEQPGCWWVIVGGVCFGWTIFAMHFCPHSQPPPSPPCCLHLPFLFLALHFVLAGQDLPTRTHTHRATLSFSICLCANAAAKHGAACAHVTDPTIIMEFYHFVLPSCCMCCMPSFILSTTFCILLF